MAIDLMGKLSKWHSGYVSLPEGMYNIVQWYTMYILTLTPPYTHPKAKLYSNNHQSFAHTTRLHRGNEVMARLEVQHTSCTTGICQGSKQIILPGSDVLWMRGDQIRNLLPGRFWKCCWKTKVIIQNKIETHWLFSCMLPKSSQWLQNTRHIMSFCYHL